MIVISLTDCPPRVRGDLSKWLCELNTGVYVGNVSARVRDALWKRICDNLRNGRATMVYPADNDQGYAFRVHNTNWEPVDYDGITLMRRPSTQTPQTENSSLSLPKSDAETIRLAQRRQTARNGVPTEYAVIDLETTGLSAAEDLIIEMAALRMREGNTCNTFSRLIRIDRPIPDSVTDLTGITDEMLHLEGVPLSAALPDFLEFIAGLPLVGYNIPFDLAFLRSACGRNSLTLPRIRTFDVLELARRKVYGLPSLKLERLAEHFQLETNSLHRALNDCIVTQKVFAKLL